MACRTGLPGHQRNARPVRLGVVLPHTTHRRHPTGVSDGCQPVGRTGEASTATPKQYTATADKQTHSDAATPTVQSDTTAMVPRQD